MTFSRLVLPCNEEFCLARQKVKKLPWKILAGGGGGVMQQHATLGGGFLEGS